MLKQRGGGLASCTHESFRKSKDVNRLPTAENITANGHRNYGYLIILLMPPPLANWKNKTVTIGKRIDGQGEIVIFLR